VVINLFDSLEAGQRFEPEARELLSRIEPTAMHYEVRVHSVPAE